MFKEICDSNEQPSVKASERSNRKHSLTSMKKKMQIFILLLDATYTVFGDSQTRPGASWALPCIGTLALFNVATVRPLH